MLKKVQLKLIRPNPNQPRKDFDPAGIAELAASIREHGLKQPITVRPVVGGYMIVMGERRFRAVSHLAENGGPAEIMCHVRAMDERQMQVEALIENLQRVDMGHLETGFAFRRMIDTFGYTPEELTKTLGYKNYVHECLALTQLTEENQGYFRKNLISLGQGVAMGSLNPRQQAEMMRMIRDKKVGDGTQARKIATMILERDAQGAMFRDEPAAREARAKDEAAVSKVEVALESAIKAVAGCFDGAELTATGTIDPNRYATTAEKARLLRLHLANVETALKLAMAQATVNGAAVAPVAA